MSFAAKLASKWSRFANRTAGARRSGTPLRRRAVRLETLESRRVLAVTDTFVGGVLTFTGDGADDTLIVTSLNDAGTELQYDLGGGPVTRSGVTSVSFDGNGGINSFTLNGSAGNDTIAVNGTTVNYAAVPFALTDVQNLTINSQGGGDTLSATGGSVTGDLTLAGGADDDAISIDGLSTGALFVQEGDNGSITLANVISTTGNQTYFDEVTLAADTTANAGGDIAFLSSLDGAFVLTAVASNAVTFAGPVGVQTPLSSVTTSTATTNINGGAVITFGDQLYNSDVNLGADAIISAGGNITFVAAVDGGVNLSVSATGAVLLNGPVGSVNPLGSLSVAAADITLNGLSVETSGDQIYTGPVTLATDTTLSVGGNLTFAGTVDGSASLTAMVTGVTTLGGEIGGSNPLTLLSLTTGGPLVIDQSITTTDSITITVNEGAVDAAGDDLTVGLSSSAMLSAFTVELNAADNITLAANSAVVTTGELIVNGDLAADNDVAGSLITLGGAITATSATITTGDDDDQMTINEIAAGQFLFSGSSPSGHSNSAFVSSGLAPAAVALHYEAGFGFDSLAINFSLSHDVAYFSDQGPGQPNTGVVNVANTFTLSFANLAPMTLSGAGGTLLLDASATPTTTSLTVQDVGAPGDGVSQVTGNGGFEATTFSGFNSLTVRGGDGSGGETITLASADAADPDGVGPGEALTAITLDGDNITGNDTNGDFLLVQSLPATITATLLGGGGDDVFLLDSNGFAAGGSLDLLLGAINIFGEDGSGLSTVSLTSCGVTKTLVQDDRVLFVDVDSVDDNAYSLSANTFQRTGLSPTGLVTYSTVERVDLLAGGGNDIIDVTSTLSSGTTIIDGGSGDDTITFGTTGDNSILFVTADAGADAVTLQSTGTTSAILLAGDADNDQLSVAATDTTTNTQLNGGAGDDTFILGSPGDSLDGLQGTVCVFGESDDGSAGDIPLTVCGTDRTQLRGDQVVFNDQNGAAGSTYTLDAGTLARTGITTIEFATIESLILNTTDLNGDIINVTTTPAGSTAIINSGGGADQITIATTGTASNLQVNAGAGDDTITLQNSGSGSAVQINGEGDFDTVFINGSGPASITEAHGDNVNVELGAVGGELCVFGDVPPVGPPTFVTICGVLVPISGPSVVFNDAASGVAHDYVLAADSFTRDGTVIDSVGFGTTTLIATSLDDTITVTNTAPGSATFINAGVGEDTITIQNTGDSSILQVNAGSDNDTVNVWRTGLNSITEINGEAGDDLIVFGTPATEPDSLRLDGLQGKICVFGGDPLADAHDGSTGLNPTINVCGIDFALLQRDRVIFNDQNSPTPHTYTLNSTDLSRDGLPEAIDFFGIETVVLNTTDPLTPPAPATPGDAVLVTGTLDDTTTFINTGAGEDTVDVQNTGGGSVLQVNGGTEIDTITLQNSGGGSAVEINAGAGNDLINVWRTAALSRTEVNGQDGDDTTTLGTPATEPDPLQLDSILGKVCVFGGEELVDSDDGTAGLNPLITVCGTPVAFPQRDRVIFNDQNSPLAHTYTLNPTSLTRDGLPEAIDFIGIETVELNTTDPAGPLAGDTIQVTGTGIATTTFINSAGGNDAITIANTGVGSVLQVNAGSGNDEVTLQNTGALSLVEVNAGAGNDSINVWRTGVNGFAEVNGQDGDDTTTLGTPATEPDSLRLDGLQGKVCVFGGDELVDSDDNSAGLNPVVTVCGVPAVLFQRDRVIFNDQDSPTPHTYTLAPTSLSRDGIPQPIDFVGIETVVLSTTDLAATPGDTVNVTGTGDATTTFINTGAGDDTVTIGSTGFGSIVQVNAGSGDDTITLQDSGDFSAVEINGETGNDNINVFATGNASLTELNGGDGDDELTLGSPANSLDGLQGTICIFGDGQDGCEGPNPTLIVCGVDRTLARGDIVTFRDAGSAGGDYTLDTGSLSRSGLAAAITFETVETVVLNTSVTGPDTVNLITTIPAGTTIINTGGGGPGDDTIIITTTGDDSNLQVNSGAGIDSITLQNNGANSGVELNGGAGNDAMNIWRTALGSRTELNGQEGDDTFVIGLPSGPIAGNGNLDFIQGKLCVFGGTELVDSHNGSAGLNPSIIVCGDPRALLQRDRVVFNDQASPAVHTYTLNPTSLIRDGIPEAIDFVGLETVVLNTTDLAIIAPVPADTVTVTGTAGGTSTFINALGGNDTVTVQSTGVASILQVNAGVGDDTVTVQTTGDNSAVAVLGEIGNDEINLEMTGFNSATDLNGGIGDDAFTLGTPVQTLDNLRGDICIFGEEQDGSLGLNPTFIVCGVDRTLARGDRLTFNDQNGGVGDTYTLTSGSLARTGVVATITYETIETVVLNAEVPSSLVNVTDTGAGGTTIINEFSGFDVINIATTGIASNLQVNAGISPDTITLLSSGAGSATELNGQGENDSINVWATGPNSRTEINGGDGDDTITLGSNASTLSGLQGTICVFGDAHDGSAGANPPLDVRGTNRALLRRDQLVFNDQTGPAGSNYTLTPSTLARTGLDAAIMYETVETVILNTTAASADTISVVNTVADGTTVISSLGGSDVITISTTGAGSRLQVNAGADDDTINLQNTGAASATQLNGEAGADTFNIRGSAAGSDTQINGGDDHDHINVGSPAQAYPPIPPGTSEVQEQVILNTVDEASATDPSFMVLGNVGVNGGSECDELFIRGSAANDVIIIGLPGSGAQFEIAQIECLSVFAGAGDDRVENNTFTRSLISGGAGNDALFGGDSADLIFGGPGVDTIDGGLGDDFLYPDQSSTGVLTPADFETITGGGGTDNVVSAGRDTLINITGMVVEEQATKNVLTFLKAQFMAFTPGNIQALFEKGIVTRCDCGPGSAAATAGVFNPATGTFFLRNSNTPGVADQTFVFGAGGAGYTPLAGDWDGDGIDTPGLYNPATGSFFLRNTNGGGLADWSFTFGPGGLGWTPIVGDWNGDGVDTVGLFNTASSVFFLRNTHAAGVADVFYSFGPAGAGWLPIAGDWDGDLVDTVGLYSPTTSDFFLRNAHAPGVANIVFTFGSAGSNWLPIAGDWNGIGFDTVGLQSPTTSTFFLRQNGHGPGPADVVFSYGAAGAGWLPIIGDWNGPSGIPQRLDVSAAASSAGGELSADALQSAADAAMARWAVAGLGQSSLDRLASIDVQLADLAGDELGAAANGVIYIDRDAAGHGWFVDATPAADEEFTAVGDDLIATSGPARDRADLLSVLIHEMGHELGLSHSDSDHDLMAKNLALGVRQLPTARIVDRIFGEE